MKSCFFPPPAGEFQAGGAHLTIYLVPVFEGRLAAFDVAARVARGRWLPWNVLGFRQNPYEAAAALADDWCDGTVADLRLVDVLPGSEADGSWELAIVFRAELTAAPHGDADRKPVLLDAGETGTLGPFQPAELQRWIAMGPARPPAPLSDGGQRLVF